jgi:adenine-specific DNA-methyltransferase
MLRFLHVPSGLFELTFSTCLEKLVDHILSAKRANPQADTSAMEREIDQLVYQLYGLTEEEVKIVEGIKK